ncbi:hypothetical protein Tco_1147332 [Tanacetum coccineum]
MCHRLIVCSIDGWRHAKSLRRYASRRKCGAMTSGGQFFAYLAEHFGQLTEQRLQGLTIGDTCAWVALGPERQPDAAARAPKDVEGAHAEVEGVQADLAPVQAPQPPLATASLGLCPKG